MELKLILKFYEIDLWCYDSPMEAIEIYGSTFSPLQITPPKMQWIMISSQKKNQEKKIIITISFHSILVI